jgi:hypothetical protein
MQQELLTKLKNDPLSFKWRRHGIGFIKAYLNEERTKRVHVFHKRFLTPGITIHHTHPWHLFSEVLKGNLVNTRFRKQGISSCRFMEGVISCCDFKGVEGEPVEVGLLSDAPEIYTDTNGYYFQWSDEIHMTEATDGTVTVVTLVPAKEEGKARVYWPVGSEYVNADISELSEEDILEAVNCT